MLSPPESALLSEELYLIEYGCTEGDLADPSAAFDTVRHDILLDRLESRLGVTDQTLNWLTSYLSDRTQRVAVNRGLSDTFPFAQRVPWPTSVHSIYQRTIRCSGSTLAKRALLRR